MQLLLGDKMRILRIREGLTQEDMASLTSISQTYISALERNRMIPTDEWLQRIKDVLGWDSNTDKALALLATKELV